MDNITHTLVAVALSRAGANRLAPYATATLIVAASLPDIDAVTLSGGAITYLQYHRGFTHSLLGVTLLAALLTLLVWPFASRSANRPHGHSQETNPGVPLKFGRLFALCLIGTWSHPALDLLNSYGVRLFEPFSHRWYALDLVYIIDPWILTTLVLSLSIPWLLRLVSEEIGAQPGRAPGRAGAIFALVAFLAFVGMRQVAHARAVEGLGAHLYRGLEPLRVGAFPDPLSPFVWHGVVETENTMEQVKYDAIGAEFDPGRARTLYKPEHSPPLAVAEATRTVKIFLQFARFPLATVETTEDGEVVFIRDLRFDYATRRRRGFITRVAIDRQHQVREEQFWFPMTSPPHIQPPT